ncbi:leucine-rich PPR motif-containing protein, mitochondrial [Morone saxatilis]|uniref:leucine-rich PPR motif-containing protein, mitochondrial n=1 Tax=Morone saxatilis TaxID=34816 RepID=UPI0015E1F477|nr:leucine-rich PPR motif-containing protein, mitochondrial [Morone saxatilis]
MAALLRSARLLKFSPSGLLQVAGTKRSGPPLSRLYSGAPVGSGTGLLTRHISPAPHNASSRVLPYAVQCVRNCAVAREQKDDVSMLVRSKQAQEFDEALTKLDNSVRRTGRITKTLLLKVFDDTCRADHPSASQALLLLRSCGSLLPELPLAERTELAHSIWGKLQELGAPYDISHYNALLKVYLQNEFKFSPIDFLAKMEAANVKPNRVTYQRLIAAYCQYGDIEGASTILGVMKSKDLPITEAVFSSLIIGHARGGDINSAKNILNVMGETGISPSPDTYVSLLNAYAETGDMKSLKETLEKTDSSGCTLMDRDILQIIYTLAKAGHHQFVPEMIKRLRLERGYIPDAMNMCLNLTTQGMDNTAFTILETFRTVQLNSYDTTQPSCGNFFIRHCVNIDMPLEKVTYYCKELQESNMHDTPLNFALSCVLENKKTGMAIELMKIMKKQDLPIRPHYFWPLLTQHLKDVNTAGVDEVLKGMRELGVDPDVKTLNSYVLPVFSNIEDAQQALKTAGVFVNEEILLASKIEKLAHENLAEVYTLMSDTSSTSFDWTLVRSSLIKAFKNPSITEALDMLKEIKEKEMTKHEMHSTSLFHLLNSIALKGDMSTVQQLQDTIFALGLAKPSINLCSPLITAYLQRKDLAGALEAMETIHKRFGFLPRMQDVTVTLVEMGNTELLQKAMDFLSEKRGEMTMLYSLFFAFLQTEHYYEARKVIEVSTCILRNYTGLRARALKTPAVVCREMHFSKPEETNDWKKAQEVWSKMEEENVTPKERTLHMLADILKSNGQEVPFEINETWYKEAGDKEVNPATAHASISNAEFQDSLVNLCKKGQGKEAFELLKDANEKNVSLKAVSYDHVIRSLLAKGFLEEALTVIDIAMSNVPGFIVKEMANNLLIVTYSKQGRAKEAFEKLKSMLEMKQSPSQLAITRLLQAYGNQGDVAGVQELQSLLNDSSLAKMLFVNNTALAHIRNGNVESAVELLEEVFTNPDNQNAGTSFVFRKVLEENNDKALDKLSAMAERLANQFDCYKPAVDLFYQLLDMDKVEDAKFMLASKCQVCEFKLHCCDPGYTGVLLFVPHHIACPSDPLFQGHWRESFRFYTEKLKAQASKE